MVLEFFCNICHEAYASSQDIRTTSCGHVFHHRCLTDWLARSTTCPECRRTCYKSNLLKIFIKSRTALADDIQGSNITLMNQLEEGVKKLSKTQHLLDESEKNFAELSNKLDTVTKELMGLSMQKNGGGKGGHLQSVMDDAHDCAENAAEFRKRPGGGGGRTRLDQETFNLFQYAKNLRKVGYKDVFFKGPEIYARKNFAHPKIHIQCRDDVDDLMDEDDSWY